MGGLQIHPQRPGLHLAFEPDRMGPVQFIGTDANGNEKEASLALLEAGAAVLLTGAMSLLVCLGRLPACLDEPGLIYAHAGNVDFDKIYNGGDRVEGRVNVTKT